MSFFLWKQCISKLQTELSATEFSMWIRPLQAELINNTLAIYAPNQFVFDWVRNNYLNNINILLNNFCGINTPEIIFKVGKKNSQLIILQSSNRYLNRKISFTKINKLNLIYQNLVNANLKLEFLSNSNINPNYNFDNFVEGKSNKLACIVTKQIVKNPGYIYNPLFLYGESGIGKTHLLHAVGNSIIRHNINAKIIYINSERFVQNIVKALQSHKIEEFKSYYCSANILLIDDVQFFAKKEYTQKEFFHIFNTLLDNNKQVILTSDCCPKKIIGLEDRLISRLSCGLIAVINPPELETRMTILTNKFKENNIFLPKEVIFFIASRLCSNVRELEGAVNCISARNSFTDHIININFIRKALDDILNLQSNIISIKTIQKTVAKYYKIRLVDLLSKRRFYSITLARQIAILLSRELTSYSLSEIAHAFGKLDHTTILHSCRKIKQLLEENHRIRGRFSDLVRILTS